MLTVAARILRIAPERGGPVDDVSAEWTRTASLGGDCEKTQRSPGWKSRKVRFIRGPIDRVVLGTACA
jgi:hypothetical protein